MRRARFITFEDFQPSIKHIRDVGVSVGWYLTLKSISDPCQSTNRKRTFEIDSFRTISCGIGKELSFWQRRTGGFKCFSDYSRDTIKCGNFGYKWTISCVLVVRNMQKGTTLIDGNHYKCGENCSKIRGHTPRPPRLRRKDK